MNSPTSIEIILYNALEDLGIKYVAQYPIPEAGTVADAYVPDSHMVVYADGDYWHSLPKTKERDQRQGKKLAELGYKVRRLSESDLRSNATQMLRSALNI